MTTNERTPEVYNGAHTHSSNNNEADALNTIGKRYVIIKNRVINKRVILIINLIKIYELKSNINIINKT